MQKKLDYMRCTKRRQETQAAFWLFLLRKKSACSASGTLRSTTMWIRKTQRAMISCRSKNLSNEWFIRDTSRKNPCSSKAKAERGERLGTRAPYGYVKDLETKMVIDEEAAAVVKRIFALCAAGNGPSRIATILTKRKGVLSQLLHLPEIRPDAFRLGHHEAVPLVRQCRCKPVGK